MSEDIGREAMARYEAAEARAVAARKAWEDDGSELTITYVNGLEGIHPLLKVLIDSEAHADRMMKSLSHRQARAGRPQGASSAPDRQPRRKLKAVG